jgi:hypothetical protein
MSPAGQPATRVSRRVVTTLFGDLVDFTGLCERHDPEDVDRLLRGETTHAFLRGFSCRSLGMIHEARAIFTSLGAKPALRESDRLLAQSGVR